MEDKRLLKTFVWHEGHCFFVSTIERDSSAAISPPPRYAETRVSQYDWDTATNGEMLYLGSGELGHNPWRQHMEFVEALWRHGRLEASDGHD